MATTNDIYAEMQRYAPLELAESWDNPGLLVDCGGQMHRVLAALDITPEVVAEAAAKQCEMIVSHHPVIFDPLKKIGPQDVPFQLVQAGISAICMHTNLDAAEGGVNDVLADLFGIRQSGILDFKLGDIFQDAAILKEASDTAAFIMEKSDKFLSKDSPLFKKMMKSTHLEDGMLNL